MEQRMETENGNQKESYEKKDWVKEEEKLRECVDIIRENIDSYTAELMELSSETKELYDNYRSDNPELHNELVVGLDLKSQLQRALNKNHLALKKPYFGRIDYVEHEENKWFSLYLGKNGIQRDGTNIVIVDWRAPISSVYYDSDIGESSYLSPYEESIPINLNLKRTYEISEGSLVDYYDTDVIANDEFLTKYLSKNKEVVLGEIIATIQKEQNEIIRDTPWHSMVVQGVAGSGKTTVAMHRISYILYNYKEKFRSDEMYIIGSNKMLLNYITGVLPNLDVYNINQMTLDEFLFALLKQDISFGKGKYRYDGNFNRAASLSETALESALKSFKGSINLIRALEFYLNEDEKECVNTKTILYHGSVLYSEEEILSFLRIFQGKSLQEKIELLNKRLVEKVRLKNEREDQEKDVIRTETQKYKEYFGSHKMKFDFVETYRNFVRDMLRHGERYEAALPDRQVLELFLEKLENKILDLYDTSMLIYIKKRLKSTELFDYVQHIIVDEAQDFGVSVFYVLRKLFPECTFTIMGDVSQNINYDTGMNDWEALRTQVFDEEKDKFYCLAKSYRNTVEISNFAGKVLKHCTFKTYDIEPIIRHGKEVAIIKVEREEDIALQTAEIIKNSQQAGYTTVAVICRTVEETYQAREKLQTYVEISQQEEDMEEMTFSNGVMVLPIHMTKGLEFDCVILWNPDDSSYRVCNGDAKLLYVAITRALHEFHIVYKGNLSELLL